MTTTTMFSGPRPPLLLARWSTLSDIALLTVSTAGIALLVKLVWPRFTFWGDNAESFFPLWHMYGASIRSGAPSLYQADGWGGGNVVGEAAYGLFNPVVIVNSVLISMTDRLSLASFLVMVEFMCLLAIGVYLVARSYGARRSAAIAVGVMMPFAGFTMFYEAGNWASGLMSITWVVWFWWAAHDLTAGRRGPVAAIIAGALAATVGNPYAVLGILVVFLGLACELAARRRWSNLSRLVLMGATVGLAVAAAYAPLLFALADTVRTAGESIWNNNYLTPGLGDLLGLSSPSYQPRMNAWYSRWDAVPSTYLSWLILPLLPWIRWRSAFIGTRLISVYISGGVFLLLCLGPQHVWLFQWPIRMIEYVNVGILVIFAVLVTARLARDHIVLRATLTGAIVALGLFVAWSSRPELFPWHAMFAVVTAVGVFLVLALVPRLAARAVAILAITGTAVIAPVQGGIFGWDRQSIADELDQEVPVNLQTLRDKSAPFTGTVLQIASLKDTVGTDAVESGDLSFGNNRAAAGIATVNRYTGIGFLEFALASGLDYRGSTPRPDALARVFAPLEGYGIPLVEAMGVDTLVVGSFVLDRDLLPSLTAGWTVGEVSPNRTVMTAPWKGKFTAHASRGVKIGSAEEDGDDIVVNIESGTGTVLLPRLAWAGYSAEADGRRVAVSSGPAGLLEVDVADGVSQLRVSYRVAGIEWVAAAAATLVLATVAQQWVFAHRRRRHD